MGALLADGQTLSLGKSGATQMVFTPSNTASNEKISLTNTAGTAADVATKSSPSAGGINLTADSVTSAVVIKADYNNGTAVHIDADEATSVVLIEAGTLDVDASAAITLDAAAASNLTTSSGILTLNGADGVNIIGNAAEIDITHKQVPLILMLLLQ